MLYDVGHTTKMAASPIFGKTLKSLDHFHELWYVGHPISSDNGLISQKLL